MPNVFSNFGLAMEGANAAQSDAQKLKAGEQSLATGQIGLENLQREDADQKAGRAAFASGMDAGGTPQGSLLDMSDALARRGDAAGALKARQAFDQLRNMGAPELVDAIRTNDKAGDRPDLLPLLGRVDKYRDAKAATFDGKGNLTITHANGTPENVPIHTLGILTGQFQPFQQVVAPGSSIVSGVKGDTMSGAPATSVVQAPPAEKTAATRMGTIYDVATGKVLYEPPENETWTLGEVQNGENKIPVSFNKKTGQAVILGPGGRPESAKVTMSPTGDAMVTVGDKVFKVNPAQPGTPGSSGFLGFGATPGTPGKPATLEPVAPAGGPPSPDAKKAPDGNWYRQDPQSGKWLRAVSTGEGAPAAPAAAQAPRPANVPPEDETAWRTAASLNAQGLPAVVPGKAIAPESERPAKPDMTVYTRTKNPRGGYIYTPAAKIARGGNARESGKTMAEWKALDSGEKVAGKADGGKVTRYGL